MSRMNSPLFVGGVQVGLPLGSSNARVPTPGGRILYVGNLAAATSLKESMVPGNGSSPDEPLATLFGANGAMAKLQNRKNVGDIIYVLPGHVESVAVADAASATGSASGFSVIGLGSGTNRPAFNWTASTSTWLLDTSGVELSNLVLNLCGNTATGALTVATPITVSAAGCRIVDCFINWGQDTDTGCGSTLGAIAVVAATDFEFINNDAVNLDTAGTLAVSLLSLNGASSVKILRNRIMGATTSTTVGPVHFVTTPSLNVQIAGNYIENTRTSATKALTAAVVAVTGTIMDNRFFVALGIVAVTTTLLPATYECFTANAVAAVRNGALDIGSGTST